MIKNKISTLKIRNSVFIYDFNILQGESRIYLYFGKKNFFPPIKEQFSNIEERIKFFNSFFLELQEDQSGKFDCFVNCN